MSNLPISLEVLRELICAGEAKDPLVFLECVMGGRDPRQLSSIYKLVMEIDELTNGDISKSDWQEVLDHVNRYSKFSPVSMTESLAAGKALAEYLYPKRKQIDSNVVNNESNSYWEPLTEGEIELFKEKFNDDF